MKESAKNKISDLFTSHIDAICPDLTENKRWKISTELGKIAYNIALEMNKGTSETYNKNVQELEQHRKQFKDHIDFISQNTKIMIESFKKQGFIKIQEDKKRGKNVVVARTSMVNDMVEFLNVLNSSVIEFYKNVYKLETEKPTNITGVSQTALF